MKMVRAAHYFFVLSAAALAQVAAYADNLLPQVKLPDQYTVTYKVKITSAVTDSSRQHEGKDFIVTISSNGVDFLCKSRSLTGKFRSVLIYSAASDATYLYVHRRGAEGSDYFSESGDRLNIDKGFNGTATFFMPLLGYDDVPAKLYFIKQETLEETKTQPFLQVWRGESLQSSDGYGHTQQPLYTSSQCEVKQAGNTDFVQHCSTYFLDGHLFDDWSYSNPVKLSSSYIPRRIELNRIRPEWHGSLQSGKWMHYLQARLRYDLVSAVPVPLKASQFDIENWMPEGQPCLVRNTAFVRQPGTLVWFSFVPGITFLKDAIAQQVAQQEPIPPRVPAIVNAKPKNRQLPYIAAGLLLVCLGGWLARRHALSRLPKQG